MGLRFGLEDPGAIPKIKYRWLFKIGGISALDENGVKCLPPRRSSRPNLGWKEQDFQHLTEQIYFPLKPTWETVELTLFDICRGENRNVVFDWISLAGGSQGTPGFYDPQSGTFNPIVDSQLKREGTLEMYDGCGNILESWTLENCYPQHIRWGELDMDSSDIVTCECTIRYDRAYVN